MDINCQLFYKKTIENYCLINGYNIRLQTEHLYLVSFATLNTNYDEPARLKFAYVILLPGPPRKILEVWRIAVT